MYERVDKKIPVLTVKFDKYTSYVEPHTGL